MRLCLPLVCVPLLIPTWGLLNKIVGWLRTTQRFIDPSPVVKPLPSSSVRRLWRKGVKNKLHRAKMGLTTNGWRFCGWAALQEVETSWCCGCSGEARASQAGSNSNQARCFLKCGQIAVESAINLVCLIDLQQMEQLQHCRVPACC